MSGQKGIEQRMRLTSGNKSVSAKKKNEMYLHQVSSNHSKRKRVIEDLQSTTDKLMTVADISSAPLRSAITMDGRDGRHTIQEKSTADLEAQLRLLRA
jgi:hypothetical protein